MFHADTSGLSNGVSSEYNNYHQEIPSEIIIGKTEAKLLITQSRPISAFECNYPLHGKQCKMYSHV